MREGGGERSVQLVDGIYMGLMKVGRGVGVFTGRVGNLVIYRVICWVLIAVRMKFWMVN